MITLQEIISIAKAQATAAVRQGARAQTVTTTDATPYEHPLEINTDSTGFIRVTVVATDSTGKKLAGVKETSYEWVGGEIAFGAVQDSFPIQTSIVGATFSLEEGPTARVRLTGIAGTVKWQVRSAIDYVINDLGGAP